MFHKQLQPGFPRQIVSCYLLFCLIAVVWLSLGIVFAVHAVLSSRTESKCLSLLGKTAAQLEIEYIRHGSETFDEIVKKIRDEHHLAYAGVAGLDDRFVAHTNELLIGTEASKKPGQQLSWGDVDATEYVAEESQRLLEFRVPLQPRTEPIGELVVATPAPDYWTTARGAAEVAPPAILAPLALIGAGALVIRRLAQPLAAVHQQLRQIGVRPATQAVSCHKLPPNNAVNVGWNRLVEALEQVQHDTTKQNLTERVAAAIQQRKEQGSLQILHNLSEGLAVTDPEGRITFANRAIAALLGETDDMENASGKGFYDFLSSHVDDPDALKPVAQAATGRAARTEVVRSCGERRRTLRVAREPLSGGSAGHVWSLRDVTQQKLAEEMRSQFIDAATHELRTPLANIKAYSETLAMMDDVDLEQQKEFCNTINSEATRLARFVDDLLSVSSMEVGSLSIHQQNVDLARLFEEVVEKVRPLTAKKSQEFEVKISEKLGETLLDKDKISAMLVNLLGNASKYTPENGRVTLQASISDDTLSISVEDSGVGIAAEELPYIFDKFFRSKDPRVLNESGTGLGLSLAREVIRLHGGDLTVSSILDKGSTFAATIPLRQEARL